MPAIGTSTYLFHLCYLYGGILWECNTNLCIFGVYCRNSHISLQCTQVAMERIHTRAGDLEKVWGKSLELASVNTWFVPCSLYNAVLEERINFHEMVGNTKYSGINFEYMVYARLLWVKKSLMVTWKNTNRSFEHSLAMPYSVRTLVWNVLKVLHTWLIRQSDTEEGECVSEKRQSERLRVKKKVCERKEEFECVHEGNKVWEKGEW